MKKTVRSKILKAFGAQVGKLRKKRKMSVIELARITHLNAGRIKKIESGESNLQISTIFMLAKGLGFPPEQLLLTINIPSEPLLAEQGCLVK